MPFWQPAFWYDMDGTPITAFQAEKYFQDTYTRRLAYTHIFTERGVVTVSTVFLVLDHNIGLGGPPLIWETMVLTDGFTLNEAQIRYSTREQAIAGHKDMLALVYSELDLKNIKVITTETLGFINETGSVVDGA